MTTRPPRIVLLIGLVASLCALGSEPLMKAIAIPSREHGYQNLETSVLHSRQQLTAFIERLRGQEGWNDRETFIQALQGADIDFEGSSLLIYCHTEPSGGIQVQLAEPLIEGGRATIQVTREVPFMSTTDMAFHAYAWQVSKSLEQVTFIIDGERQIPVAVNPR